MASFRTLCFALALVSLATASCHGFYLPGVAPQDFAQGDLVQPRVGRVSSARTHIPFGKSLGFFFFPRRERKPSLTHSRKRESGA